MASVISHLYVSTLFLLQGVDQSPKPLIIGPEEDYDPGYFNNEVTVFWFTPFIFLPCFPTLPLTGSSLIGTSYEITLWERRLS